MSKQRFTLSVLLVVALLVPGVILAQPAGPQTAAVPSAPTGSTLFVENAGQWPAAARFQAWGSPAGTGLRPGWRRMRFGWWLRRMTG